MVLALALLRSVYWLGSPCSAAICRGGVGSVIWGVYLMCRGARQNSDYASMPTEVWMWDEALLIFI